MTATTSGMEGAGEGEAAAAMMYSRSHLVAWGNRLLGSACSSLHEIPPERIAVLLRSIAIQVPNLFLQDSEPDAPSFTEHDFAALVSLHGVQFNSPGRHAALHNTIFLLQLAFKLSSALEEARQHRTTTPATATATDGCDEGVVPHASATAPRLVWSQPVEEVAAQWVAGTAFVEELKLWRWMRALAADLPDAILLEAVHQYTYGGDEGDAGEAHVGSKRTRSPPRPTPCASSSNDALHRPAPTAVNGTSDCADLSTLTYPPVDTTLAEELAASTAHLQKVQQQATIDAASQPAAPPQDQVAPCGLSRSLSAMPPSSIAAASSGGVAGGSISWEVLLEGCGETSVVSDLMMASSTSASHHACPTCPLLVTQAIQCNLAAIDQLEKVRLAAIEACMKKDSSALLAALTHVV